MTCVTCAGYSSRKCPCCNDSDRWTPCEEEFVQTVAKALDEAIRGAEIDGDAPQQWETFVMDYIDQHGSEANDKYYVDAIIDAFHDMI